MAQAYSQTDSTAHNRDLTAELSDDDVMEGALICVTTLSDC